MLKLDEVLSSEQKKSLNVLEPDETRREQKWQENVNQAKLLLGRYKEIRQSIAMLALEVCVIHHGGRARHERYSLARFARDIEVPHKTLLEWVRIYNDIYKELSAKEKETVSFSEMREIDVRLRGTDRGKNTKKDIRAVYTAVKKENGVTRKMRRYLKHLKTILFNVENPMMIKDCDQEIMTEMLHVARQVVKELAKQDKK